ncbi:MAG: protein kinase [Deltaproteobacteria bacterium]|nr:protein kinase [Deltaproteobacteria bacterium]
MTTTSNHKKHLLKPGQVLNGRWEIVEHIATGGKGEVYRARQPKLEREVAVKVVSQELIDAYEGDQEEIDAEMERFRREVLAMAATRHPNVLQVYDFEQDTLDAGDGQRSIDYIVMEYIPGDTLSSTIPAQGMAGDEDALREWVGKYFLPVLDGVEHMHAQGIVHRDLKPSNVLLDGEIPKLSDFGLVGGGEWKPVTRSHHVIGTLAYMAPEQYMDLAEAGFRADIYSLGKMLYKAAVGTFGKDTMKPLQAAFLARPDTPFLKALDQVIRKATAEESEDRYASVAELREALGKLPGMAPATGPWRRRLALAIGLAVVLAALLAWGVWYHFEGMNPVQPITPAQVPATTAAPAQGPPPEEIKGRDEATLRLVPAGKAPDGTKVAAFYLEATRVTNHQFVEFLNATNSSLEVAQGVVKHDDEPWLYLGEVRKGLEPLDYRGGRFRIKDPALAAHPVVKVTAYGAAAYAAHFGRRLPSPAELNLAAASSPAASSAHGSAVPLTGDAQMESMHAAMQSQTKDAAPATKEPAYFPVTHYPPNKLGIRGLNSPMGSWARAADNGFVVVEKSGEAKAREAWQGLDWVGFRTALSAKE